MDKNKQLILSLKTSTDYVLSIYKLLDVTPKMPTQITDLIQYSRNLEKLLKKVIGLIHQNLAIKINEEEMTFQLNQLKQTNAKLVRENKDFKCQVDVLEKQLQEGEEREKQLRRKLKKSEKISEEFEMKVNRIRKQSEDGLRKIIESKRTDTGLNQRKKSLPIINSYEKREKMGLLFLIDSPERNRTNRLVEHLRRKY